MRRTFVAAVSLVLVGACGGSDAHTEEAAEPLATSGAEQAPVPWSAMNQDQRFAFMQDVVLPEMKSKFQAFNSEEFAEFTCATCHGENAQEVGFQMPNGLAPLDPAQIPGMFGSDQPMAVFMTQQVWPRMTELLQQAPYNPETHEGFSCLNCHATVDGG